MHFVIDEANNGRYGCELWPAKAELVDMELKAGANVFQELKGKLTARVLAVKYADLQTFDSSPSWSQHTTQTQFGHNCIFNAIEHPHPAMIERVLQDISPNETSLWHYKDGSAYRATVADRMMLMMTQVLEKLGLEKLGGTTGR
jgi:hypothetical protein